MSAIKVSTISGQQFFTVADTNGRPRTMSALEAIGRTKADISAHEIELTTANDMVKSANDAIRAALIAGRDTAPLRARLREIESLRTETTQAIAKLRQIAAQIRQAVIDAEAGQILRKSITAQNAALANLSTEAFQ